MKITKILPVPDDKIGRVKKNGVITEPHEDSTALYLTQFGFSIEFIKPTSTSKVNNPDILIMGTIWEMKAPESSSKQTIKKRFRKASKQAPKIIFDLRWVKAGADKVEKQIMELLENDGRVRRMIIIESDGTVLDIIK